MGQVKIEVNDKIKAYSPYHPDLPAPAKRLGGRWDASARCWTYDVRDEERVRELYTKIYGTYGEAATGDLVNIRVIFHKEFYERRSGIYVAGRCLGRATGRDSGAKLAEGVILLEGRITSGGSVKNWGTEATEGTVVEVRDVPRAKAQEEIDNPSDYFAVEIIEDETNEEALLAEREKLMARIAEIDAILNR